MRERTNTDAGQRKLGDDSLNATRASGEGFIVITWDYDGAVQRPSEK